jgi:serine/threonine protein kinase
MIGQGAYGSVYIGISDTTGIKVAVKILNKSNSIIY